MYDMYCPYCYGEPEFSSSLEFYGVDYGSSVYYCVECDARVGTHKGSDKPLGTLANSDLRKLRMTCHNLIDPYWRIGKYKRGTVYRRLSKAMELPQELTHIAMFDEEQCKKLIGFFKKG